MNEDIKKEKILKLNAEHLAIQDDRDKGKNGCTLEELDKYLESVISEA